MDRIEELFVILRRDLTYLEGATEATNMTHALSKVYSMRELLNRFEKGEPLKQSRSKNGVQNAGTEQKER